MIPNGTFHVSSDLNNISVYWRCATSFYPKGTISADLIHPTNGLWWISRAVINPPSYRNLGIGSLMLKELINEVILHNGKRIVVMPGGYDQDSDKQYNFYQKNGFILDIFDGAKALVYKIGEKLEC